MVFRSERVRIHFNNFILFLLFLGMICLVYTNNLVYKGILVLFIGYSVLQLMYRGQGLRFSQFSQGYMLFLLWCTMSLLWFYKAMNARMLFVMFLTGLVIPFLPYYLRDQHSFTVLAKIILLSTVILTLHIIGLVGVKKLTNGRLLVEIVNSNRFGVNLAYSSVFCLYLADKSNKLYAVCIIPIFVMILVSGSKAGIFIFILVLSVYYIISQRLNAFNLFKIFCVVVIGLGAGVWVLKNVGWAYEILGRRLFDFINVVLTGSASRTGHSTAIREDMIAQGLGFFLRSPVWGHGLDNFKYLYGEVKETTVYAHNTYIEVLVDLGLLGFIFYYFPRFWAFCSIIKRVRSSEKELCLALALLLGLLFEDFVGVSFNEIYEQCLLAVIWIIINITSTHEVDNSNNYSCIS